ncbi:DUF262 domain-containing protein [Pseudoxanthomonas sacheonensis]|uniref:GmrSD restriction endonucleases N-terminal domain-containing protein n=1 Tax=Pseudoxanthomonas sacheonensis TaxID=443615 RepID=A0ABU1RQH7_9GAMM|nr:DUF262 domain-containing protein [Pseudoxanthomonas sacheonensis]MDR6841028.1 hypothetical protein [Pseudoxanthomonas sacheonensis]
MQSPLNAAAPTAGSLMSTSMFEVPIYQREYAWTLEEVEDFWNDIDEALSAESYFLGLLILTKEGNRYHVVDGQQRILTLTMLAAALRDEAIKNGRKALADKIQSDFLKTINYNTDAAESRVVLSDVTDNETLQKIIEGSFDPEDEAVSGEVSDRIRNAYRFLCLKLRADIASDPFRRLGIWTEFITDKLYFAVFVHPDARSAYRVFEAINTRGRDLTTAELLKNFVLSQTAGDQKQALYSEWQSIAQQFQSDGANSFVQYIRHVVTVEVGHILPKDLFDLVAGRGAFVGSRDRPSIQRLMELLRSKLPLYVQMIDPGVPGPADGEALSIFSALNSLSVISVRPILMALIETQDDPIDAMRDVLRLVVRRIVVGNLGTGNVERRFGEAAKSIRQTRDWVRVKQDLADLVPSREDFVSQLSRRSLNKQTLTFMRRSIIHRTMSPEREGHFHLIRPKQAYEWLGLDPEEITFWTNTIGNSFLATTERRSRLANTWEGFKQEMLDEAADGELKERLREIDDWDAEAIESMGSFLAEAAANVWY